MAMNPMQRRARNSFLTGMLVTLLVMAVIVGLLFYKIKQLNEDKERLLALQKEYYVVAEDIKSGEAVTEESIVKEIVQTTVNQDDNLTKDDFYEKDDEGNEFIIEYVSKLDLPAGTIITKDMVSELGDEISADQRIQEYNMIVLPSQLTEGDYIDIRLSVPSGSDFIVLPKKKVLQCTADTIWLKLKEDEILTLNNAIVESYQATGSKLYATTYVEAGRQESAIATYPVNEAVVTLIERNPNIIIEAKNALISRYNDQAGIRTSQINSAIIQDPNAVQSGVQSEVTALKSAREAFVSELEGSKSLEEN